MSTVTDQSNLFGLIQFSGYTATNAGTFGAVDMLSPLSLSNIQISTFNSTALITTTFNTYYKMRGYNPITQQYEYWHCMGQPLLSSPNGHSLINITIIDSWEDR
jgi:hypothetical protein